MTDRFFASWGRSTRAFAVLAGVVFATMPALLTAQAPAAAMTSPAATWTLARTPDGQPDLQGYWTAQSFTPLERPRALAGRAFLTEEEAAEFFTQAVEVSYETTFGHPDEAPLYDATTWGLDTWQQGVRPSVRTSMIVDPPDGRIPALTPEAAEKQAAARAAVRRAAPDATPPDPGNTTSGFSALPAGASGLATREAYFWRGQWHRWPQGPEDVGLGVRCLYSGGGSAPLLPSGYTSTYQIVQSPDYVVILYERSIPRVVALNGRPHPPANIRQWYGDSIGHWEADTLVVETTNRNDKTNFRGANVNLRVIERFTRVAEDTIQYEFTVEDPTTWTRSWSGEEEIGKVDGPLFEFACHEGNRGLVNVLSAARAVTEKEAAEEGAMKGPR